MIQYIAHLKKFNGVYREKGLLLSLFHNTNGEGS